MTAQQMWDLYSTRESITSGYEAWSFGGDADALAALVRSGVKTATTSAYVWYESGEEPMPRVGNYSVVLDSRGEAVCIIRTTRVYRTSFSQVSQAHAWREGEGDRSLAYWRRVHEDFFRQELKTLNLVFSPSMPVVCEEFVCLYP